MITLRKAAERGHFDHGWLDTYHTFSFASYFDRDHMGFRDLRVINEDTVAPGKGFGTHPHRDMEIITYVLSGRLAHADSMGNEGRPILPGEVQRMTAGTGVTHSEFNGSDREPCHLLQIWILPEKKGLEPSYEQKAFADSEKRGKLRLLASRDAREGSVLVHQDVHLYASILEQGETLEYANRKDRHAWVQIARGSVNLNGQALQEGDGVAVSGDERLVFDVPSDGSGSDRSGVEFLLFDLA